MVRMGRLSNVPPPIPRFVGRSALLRELGNTLRNHARVVLVGEGGIGKTASVIQFAHRNHDAYPISFFVAADNHEKFRSGFNAIYQQLCPNIQTEPDHDIRATAVLRWLEDHDGWLLILDNVMDVFAEMRDRLFEDLIDYLPTNPRGRVLLTTRDPRIAELAHVQVVGEMAEEEGMAFLLHSADWLSDRASLDRATFTDREAFQ